MSQRLVEEAKKRERFEELRQHLEQELEVSGKGGRGEERETEADRDKDAVSEREADRLKR